MADTKHHHSLPVEGDGISYSGIIWFIVVLTVVTVVCQALMWVLLRTFQHQQATSGVAPAPLAATVTERQAPTGRVYMDMASIGMPDGPQPRLLVNEPKNLAEFRKQEDEILHTYGWVDRSAGTVRIPIDQAKALLMERGLPVRSKQ
jgi:hypothetical protein